MKSPTPETDALRNRGHTSIGEWVVLCESLESRLRQLSRAIADDAVGQYRSALLRRNLMGDRERGLYQKFTVQRTDGSDKPNGKHDGCEYFVLDLTHDKFAIPALEAYARACRNEYPLLAADLVERRLAAQQAQGAGEPWETCNHEWHRYFGPVLHCGKCGASTMVSMDRNESKAILPPPKPALSESASARSEGPTQGWMVFCAGCRKEWAVPYRHPGKSICAGCESILAAHFAPVDKPGDK